MRYLARISYDGSKFQGFQRLNNGKGVQNVLESVLSNINRRDVLVKGAGRTDAGVHALDQCIHFDLDVEIALDKLQYSMNRMLPNSISVESISIVDNSFHARHSVKTKTYVYKVFCGKKNPFLYSYVYFFPFSLDLVLMKKACGLFLGMHNFHNFVSGERENYTSIIDSFNIYKEDDFIIFEVKGKSFYRYMVRNLVGSILDVGRGKASLDDISEALQNPLLEKRFSVAPSMGLYLMKIEY